MRYPRKAVKKHTLEVSGVFSFLKFCQGKVLKIIKFHLKLKDKPEHKEKT